MKWIRIRNMATWLDFYILLVVVKQGCDGRGLAIRPYPDHQTYNNEDLLDIPTSFHEYPFVDLSIHPVSVDYFTEQASKAKTYHDILRIFYGHKTFLTDDIIDSLVTSPSMTSLYSMPLGRPRIGGLSDTMSFLLQQQRRDLQAGLPASPLLQDRPSPDNFYLSSQHSVQEEEEEDDDDEPRRQSRHRRRKEHRRKNRRAHNRIRELQEATLHYKEMEERTACRNPVPVVLRIRDISPSASREYFPKCTIVHRCRRDAGCCNETSECAPKSNTTFSKYFLALEYKDSYVQPAQQLVESFTFENHTECECKPIPLIPKCLQCPHPFYLRRENKTECSCDCFDKDQTCLRIKKGRKPLTEDQLRCIKEGACHAPNCQFGEFEQDNVRSGYCPRKYKHHRRTHSTHRFRSITPYRRKITYR